MNQLKRDVWHQSTAKDYQRFMLHGSGIIRQRGRTVQAEINHGGARKRQTFDTLTQAKAWLDSKACEIETHGLQALNLTDRQREIAAQAFELLPEGLDLLAVLREYLAARLILDGADLQAAVRYWRRLNRPFGGTRTIVEFVAEFLREKQEEGCRPAYLHDLRVKLGTFMEDFGHMGMHEVTAADLAPWLLLKAPHPRSRGNHLRVLSVLFNRAVSRGLIERNPADKNAIPRPKLDESIPRAFTVMEAEKMLRAAEENAQRILPVLTIGLFAGIRTGEIERMDWTAIDLQERRLIVIPEVAKLRRQRIIPMEANLAAWLAPLRRESGAVHPPDITFRRDLARVLKASGVFWIRNGLRHSFATYHLARGNNAHETASILGHTQSVDMLFRHYRALATADAGRRFFEILPSAKSNVLQFKKEA